MVSRGEANSGTFEFNTVAGNTTANGHVGGIDCGGGNPVGIVATIVVGNTQSSGSQFFGNCMLTMVVDGAAVDATAGTPDFVGGGDYHLTTSDTACINKAGTTGPALDYDDQPRPKNLLFDIGADEAN